MEQWLRNPASEKISELDSVTPSCIPLLHTLFCHHLYFPTQLQLNSQRVLFCTVGDLADKPWSQVYSRPPPPRYYLPSFSSRIGVQHSHCSSICTKPTATSVLYARVPHTQLQNLPTTRADQHQRVSKQPVLLLQKSTSTLRTQIPPKKQATAVVESHR